ncbi:MAG: rhodanese-like domain-containing protein [Candidatus Longimicrobiales bacterium M2_2A_002]
MKGTRYSRWLVMILALGVGAACADAPEQSAATRDRPAAAAAAVADTAIVYVDVRTQEEWEAGHVEGAIHIPHTEMRARHDELEAYDDEQIVVYCRSGRRSGIALDILESEGFDNVINGGGLRDLRAEDVPVTR